MGVSLKIRRWRTCNENFTTNLFTQYWMEVLCMVTLQTNPTILKHKPREPFIFIHISLKIKFKIGLDGSKAITTFLFMLKKKKFLLCSIVPVALHRRLNSLYFSLRFPSRKLIFPCYARLIPLLFSRRSQNFRTFVEHTVDWVIFRISL